MYIIYIIDVNTIQSCALSFSTSTTTAFLWCYCAIVHGMPLTGISIFGLCKISFSLGLGVAGGAQELLNTFSQCAFLLCDSFTNWLRALMDSSDCTGPVECSIARPCGVSFCSPLLFVVNNVVSTFEFPSSCSSWVCWPCASSSSSLSAKNFLHADLYDVGNRFNMISWWDCVQLTSGANVLRTVFNITIVVWWFDHWLTYIVAHEFGLLVVLVTWWM